MSLITRRKFAALIGAAGFGGLLKMGWSQSHGPEQNVQRMPSGAGHIQNRRLFCFAEGFEKPDAWERQHIHECEVCQGMFYVLIHQVRP